MKAFARTVTFARIAILGLVILMAFPLTALAQGRGRGRDRDRDFEKSERKRDKFINGHDARDGRWDGRGPNRTRQRWFDDDNFGRRSWRQRNRDFDDRSRRRRWRHHRRNFDDDDFRRLRRQRVLNRGFVDNDFNQNGRDWSSLLNLVRQ